LLSQNIDVDAYTFLKEKAARLLNSPFKQIFIPLAFFIPIECVFQQLES